MAVVQVLVQKPYFDEDGYWWETVLLHIAGWPVSAWAMDSDDVEQWVSTDPEGHEIGVADG